MILSSKCYTSGILSVKHCACENNFIKLVSARSYFHSYVKVKTASLVEKMSFASEIIKLSKDCVK